MVSEFVDSVNSVLQVQEETSRVEEVMKKIAAYSAVDVAGDFKDVCNSNIHGVLTYSSHSLCSI